MDPRVLHQRSEAGVMAMNKLPASSAQLSTQDLIA